MTKDKFLYEIRTGLGFFYATGLGPTEAYNKLKTYWDKKDYGFYKDRELEYIKVKGVIKGYDREDQNFYEGR